MSLPFTITEFWPQSTESLDMISSNVLGGEYLLPYAVDFCQVQQQASTSAHLIFLFLRAFISFLFTEVDSCPQNCQIMEHYTCYGSRNIDKQKQARSDAWTARLSRVLCMSFLIIYSEKSRVLSFTGMIDSRQAHDYHVKSWDFCQIL